METATTHNYKLFKTFYQHFKDKSAKAFLCLAADKDKKAYVICLPMFQPSELAAYLREIATGIETGTINKTIINN